MTALLTQAFEEAQLLSPEAQDALAARIMEEFEIEADEAKWSESFARSPETLEWLLNDAFRELREGEISDLGIDDL